MMENRIDELETRLMFQDDLLQKLDEVVINQQKEINELKLQVKHLSEQLKDVGNIVSVGDDSPPPHY